MQKYVDLTLPISAEMRMNPDHFPPEFSIYSTLESGGWLATRLVMSTHTGTHMDAPSHFVRDGDAIDSVPLEILTGPAQVVRCPAESAGGAIGSEDIGQIMGSRLLICTGWTEREISADTLFSKHPYLNDAAIQHVLASDVSLVGIDSPSIDYHPPSAVHKELLGAGIFLVENLVNLSKLPDTCDFVVAPLPLVGLDGSPVRAFASF